jgi:hypothetical protein
MLAMNTPSWFKGKITGPHTDNPKKLFIGLFYLKAPGDTAGGDLILYNRNTAVNDRNLKWPNPKTVSEATRIPYSENTFVIFLNSPNAVHGVTPRRGSNYPRRFVNVIAESHQRLF